MKEVEKEKGRGMEKGERRRRRSSWLACWVVQQDVPTIYSGPSPQECDETLNPKPQIPW